MVWSPGVGTAHLELKGAFTPGVGTANLDLSAAVSTNDRLITVAAITGGMVAAVHLQSDTGLQNSLAGTCLSGWSEGRLSGRVHREIIADSERDILGYRAPWRDGRLKATAANDSWRDSPRVAAHHLATWGDANTVSSAHRERFTDLDRVAVRIGESWQEASRLSSAQVERNLGAARLDRTTRALWSDARPAVRAHQSAFSDGPRLAVRFRTHWKQAGYPATGIREIVIPVTPGRGVFWTTALNLRCALRDFPVPLNLQETPCREALAYIPILRTYIVLNTASLVRLPDRTELPWTSITVATDSESWCWTLSATLLSDAAWALLQPVDESPWEVEATINSRTHQFVVDTVTSNRKFGYHSVSLSARSRSAWLDDPYQPSITVTYSDATTAQQVATDALDGTGWSLAWPEDSGTPIDWGIPAGVYSRDGTIIGRIGTIAKTVGWGLYTDPTADTLTAYPQYPVASWLFDSLTPALEMTEDPTYTIAREPVYATGYNGVYIAGTSAGKLVKAKIAGTDGLLMPQAPIVDSLFCDDSGIAARQRALYELSKSGYSETLTITLPYLTELGILKPGQYITVGTISGLVRKTSVTAEWTKDGALKIIQTLGLEVRP